MGYGRWTNKDWEVYAKKNIDGKKNVKDIYRASALAPELDPKGVVFRESVDSKINPCATPVIVGLDVTGSMGFILESMAREGLKKLATAIYDRVPIPDPHLMFMGIGDVKCDRAPLQITQFEADIRIADQLTKIYLEQGGGGNNSESYTLPWWFAAMHTKCDNYTKRGKKGYLFTIGDECPPQEILKTEIFRVLGYQPEFEKISTEKLLNLVSRQYEVFHIIVEEGSYCSSRKDKVVGEWRNVLGQRALLLPDHEKMAELIVSTLQIMNGESCETIMNSWDQSTALVLEKAVRNLQVNKKGIRNLIKF
ncbi:hypothetical protein [Anaeromicropila populeti]|uniref:VWA domain-containing protein n=1 Tax=Anaeromicropila populeti TaxID=37658 RepID=A0A1I6IE63_9FIRM|nr:hypothetical protein [Anaeromicropila populeti]SFR64988.1 hypothetical protein SAMN05661086_00752 [Anaeromicropila populeti]